MGKTLTGILLINVGTPKSTDPADVKQFLKTFLMDSEIITLPWLIRWFLVNGVIVPRRYKHSMRLYKKIWTKNGSPLQINSMAMAGKLQEALSDRYVVRLAMRYGEPTIALALDEFRAYSPEKIIIMPLYPQYATSTTKSAVDKCRHEIKTHLSHVEATYIQDFHDHPSYIDAIALKIRTQIAIYDPEYLLFTFHGLPLSRLREAAGNSSPEANEHHASWGYHAQCLRTTALLQRALAWPEARSSTAFQSRMGSARWLEPYTDHELTRLAKKGIKRVLVVAPGFISDCLETLEEIAMRSRDHFLREGGEHFQLVPCLNSDDEWICALARIISDEKKHKSL